MKIFSIDFNCYSHKPHTTKETQPLKNVDSMRLNSTVLPGYKVAFGNNVGLELLDAQNSPDSIGKTVGGIKFLPQYKRQKTRVELLVAPDKKPIIDPFKQPIYNNPFTAALTTAMSRQTNGIPAELLIEKINNMIFNFTCSKADAKEFSIPESKRVTQIADIIKGDLQNEIEQLKIQEYITDDSNPARHINFPAININIGNHPLYFDNEIVISYGYKDYTVTKIFDENVKLKETMVEFYKKNKNSRDYSIFYPDGKIKTYRNKYINRDNVLQEATFLKPNLSEEELIKLSPIQGVYNHSRKKCGVVKTSSVGTINSKNCKKIIQNFTSPLGVRTEHLKYEYPNGDILKKYVIKNDKGILLSQEHVFKHINPEAILSTSITNGIKTRYGVKIIGEDLKIIDLMTDQETFMNHLNFDIEGDISLRSLAQKIAAADLLVINKNINTIKQVNDIDSITDKNKLAIGHNPFIISHEIGHQKNRLLCLNFNNELSALYEKEKRALNANLAERKQISYFIDEEKHDVSFGEIIAEANAILTVGNGFDSERTQVLMRFFPETIAKVAELLAREKLL